MEAPNFTEIEANAPRIVKEIGAEAVDVYRYLVRTFDAGPILGDRLFQFTYRSYYRMDLAGLTRDFKTTYFALLEQSRGRANIDLRTLATDLYALPSIRGFQTLQFSFVTKLAHTADRRCPIYDAEVAGLFDFRPPYNYKPFPQRLNEYMTFHDHLRDVYAEIVAKDHLANARALFRTLYDPAGSVPEIKVLDFIFWSAGKRSHDAA